MILTATSATDVANSFWTDFTLADALMVVAAIATVVVTFLAVRVARVASRLAESAHLASQRDRAMTQVATHLTC